MKLPKEHVVGLQGQRVDDQQVILKFDSIEAIGNEYPELEYDRYQC